MTNSILLIHSDARVQKDVRALLSRKEFQLTEASELNLLEFGSPDLALIDWQALFPVGG